MNQNILPIYSLFIIINWLVFLHTNNNTTVIKIYKNKKILDFILLDTKSIVMIQTFDKNLGVESQWCNFKWNHMWNEFLGRKARHILNYIIEFYTQASLQGYG